MRAEIYNKDLELIDMIYDFKEIKAGRKFRGAGDFALSIQALDWIESLELGNIAVINDDAYFILSQEKYRDISNITQFQIKGKHINSILKRRVILSPFAFSATQTYEEQIIRMLNENIIAPMNGDRKISNFEIKRNNIEKKPTTNYTLKSMTVYEAINTVCGESGLGYRIKMDLTTKKFIFELLRGKDKTQEVFFSESFGNVANSELKRDMSDTINVCYLNHSASVQEYGSGAGIDRIEDIVEGSESSAANEQLFNRKMKENVITDILANKQFEYRKDWDLGDTVTFIDKEIGFKVEKPVLEITEIYGKKFDIEVVFGERKPLFLT